MQIQPPIQSRVCLSIALSIWDPIPPRTTVCRTQWHANICAQLTERNAPNIYETAKCLVPSFEGGKQPRGGWESCRGTSDFLCVYLSLFDMRKDESQARQKGETPHHNQLASFDILD